VHSEPVAPIAAAATMTAQDSWDFDKVASERRALLPTLWRRARRADSADTEDSTTPSCETVRPSRSPVSTEKLGKPTSDEAAASWCRVSSAASTGLPDSDFEGDQSEHSTGGGGVVPTPETFKKAVVEGDAWLVRQMIQAKADVHYCYQMDLTPLHLAAVHGRLGVSCLLLESKVDVHAVTQHGLTALQLAESEGHGAIVDAIRRASQGVPGKVMLNVYDVGRQWPVRTVNHVLRQMGTGAFHAAIQVYGKEYSFGWTSGRTPGVFTFAPRNCPNHLFRESIPLGETTLSEEEVLMLISDAKKVWLGSTYDFLGRNCCDFCIELADKLGVDSPPVWVTNLAKAARRAAKVAEDATEQVQGSFRLDCCTVRPMTVPQRL